MDRLGGFGLMVPTWLWALLPLWAASGGAIDMVETLGLMATGAAVGLYWLCCAAFVLKVERFSVLALWLSVPLVWFASFALAASDVPLTVRFHLSESALRRDAERNAGDTSSDWNTRGVGLFRVEKVRRHERIAAYTTDSKIFAQVGVIYAPDGLPTGDLPMEVEELLSARYTHLYGSWYKFEIGD